MHGIFLRILARNRNNAWSTCTGVIVKTALKWRLEIWSYDSWVENSKDSGLLFEFKSRIVFGAGSNLWLLEWVSNQTLDRTQTQHLELKPLDSSGVFFQILKPQAPKWTNEKLRCLSSEMQRHFSLVIILSRCSEFYNLGAWTYFWPCKNPQMLGLWPWPLIRKFNKRNTFWSSLVT